MSNPAPILTLEEIRAHIRQREPGLKRFPDASREILVAFDTVCDRLDSQQLRLDAAREEVERLRKKLAEAGLS